ncbi:glycoside hydrolase family 97 protein [Sporohalobacter salinus]|uniref:glycoside hydrolase family 97 protein n=1 Tax=Sporohalobacter salinus TaxID=1494606 RepID=UPI001EF81B0F|nr:glycoside hydrolase family 97 protein [Sporohalobacter salinus]MBM7623801.1 hypothetical protein [Sporohalobacter salinus]
MFEKRISILVLILTLALSFSITVSAQGISNNKIKNKTVTSPNGKIRLVFQLNNGVPCYKVFRKKINLINSSSLGFKFTKEKPLNKNFKILKISIKEFNNTWKPVWGQESEIKNHYKQLTVKLKEKKSPQRKMNLIFRVYNSGIGFRYKLPKQKNLADNIKITSENTEFSLANNNTSWWIPNDWDSYEYTYKETPLSKVKKVSTPFTMKSPKGIYLSIHEAALINYSGMALKKTRKNTLKSYLAPWPDGTKVKTKLPLKTPWRTIQIGKDAGDLIESKLIVNLNQPTALEDTSWIDPMKYIGIWWEIHIGKSDWGQHNNNHAATTKNAKHYINFAYNHLIKNTNNEKIGLLVEGWNQGWDGNWMENYNLFKFTEDGEYNDFDLSEVVNYGKKRDIEYIAHNETSGGIKHYEKQLDKIYTDYQRLGIHSIKSGYVADNGIHQPKGQHHHGQYMVNHYNHAVKKAAKYEIMINTHEPIKPTGLRRTYPNWIAREGVRGMEYNAWSNGNPPEHPTILPFTRNLAGPVDYTPGIFDVEIENKPNNRVHTTRAKQLALYVTLFSPLQMVSDLPENYLDQNGDILPEFKFIQDVPCNWDQTIVPNAKIGDYTTIVRKEKNKDEWYIGSITDENARDLDIQLDFLKQDKKYVAEIYSDGPNANWKTNPEIVSINKILVDNNDTLVASLATSGGQAIRLYPATKKEITTIPKYKSPKIKISYANVPRSVQSNNNFKITLNVENKGNLIANKKLKLYYDGKIVDKKKVRIAPKNNKKIPLSCSKSSKVADHQIRVNNLSPITITVTKKESASE